MCGNVGGGKSGVSEGGSGRGSTIAAPIGNSGKTQKRLLMASGGSKPSVKGVVY